MHKLELPQLVVNITNVCNFNCSDCQTFSNFNFTGHQNWNDYKEIYTKWAKLINPKILMIQGGEPLLNPTFNHWVTGLNEIWPNAILEVSSNGSTIKAKNQKLYDLFSKIKAEVIIRFQLHNKNRREESVNMLLNWLHGPVEITEYNDLINIKDLEVNWLKTYSIIKADSWPPCNSFDDWDSLNNEIKEECITVFKMTPPLDILDDAMGVKLVDKNNITVVVQNANHFAKSSLIPLDNRQHFKLYNSNPVLAHDACISKLCSSMKQGKFYKCHQVAHFHEFDQQFSILLDNEEDRKLLYSYNPATSDMSLAGLQEFIDNLDKPIPQCKFCPEAADYIVLEAQAKKVVFHKKKNN